MAPSGILVACVILVALGFCWFGFHYLANKPLANQDIGAAVTGNCGDTMEIGLRLKDQKVCQTRHWSDGCSISKQCIEALALQTMGKTLPELQKINMMDIMALVGDLPESHLHCAQLAETTLQKALRDYQLAQQK